MNIHLEADKEIRGYRKEERGNSELIDTYTSYTLVTAQATREIQRKTERAGIQTHNVNITAPSLQMIHNIRVCLLGELLYHDDFSALSFHRFLQFCQINIDTARQAVK